MNIKNFIASFNTTEKFELYNTLKQDLELNGTKLKLQDWYKLNRKNMSVRLQKSLMHSLPFLGNYYVHEIDRRDFFKIRNAGEITWKEFQELIK